jgi:hypothetical protein
MQIKYKFLSTTPAENAVLVRFYTDELSEEDLCGHFVDGVPVRNEDGSITRCRSDFHITLPQPAPSGADLEQYILARAPTDWLETMGKFKTGNTDPVLAAINSSVGTEYVPGQTAPLNAAAPASPEYTSLEAVQAKKRQEIAYWRYRTEVGGVTVNGARILTDRESQAQLTGALASLQNNLITGVNWKTADGTFVSLGLLEVRAIATAVAQHVQSSFDAEKAYLEQVNACTTVEEVAAIVLP